MKINWRRSFIFYVAIIVAAVVLFTVILPSGQEPDEIPLSDAIEKSQNNEIASIIVSDDTIKITGKNGVEYINIKKIPSRIPYK